jgi:hypothetical protein
VLIPLRAHHALGDGEALGLVRGDGKGWDEGDLGEGLAEAPGLEMDLALAGGARVRFPLAARGGEGDLPPPRPM